MPVEAILTATGFDFIFVTESGQQTSDGYLRLSFSGDDLAFGEDGALLSGTVTDFSIAAENPTVLPGQSVVVVIGDTINIPWPDTVSTLDDMFLPITSFLFGAYTPARLALPNGFDGLGQILFSGRDSATLSGTQASDYIDLTGSEQIAISRFGDDAVSTQDSLGRAFVNLGGGNDAFLGGAFETRVWGGNGNDTLTGGTGDEGLFGGAGRDLLRGGSGNDLIKGGTDRDVLIAGAGNDTLWGGAGSDSFVFIVDKYAFNSNETGNNIVKDFDLSEDFLRLGPSYNGTWDADDAFDRFTEGAQDRSWGSVFKEDGMHIYLVGVTVDDLTVDHFIDGATAGGYDDWLMS